MAPSVVPLRDVPAEMLRAFFGRLGVPREVADWRYLDSDFNRGRNRGYAWVRHNRMEGMIGLIPFQIGGNGPRREVNWSCDWMLADPGSNPGMGIILLRRAIESSGEIFTLGGNELTRKLLPRIATHTVPDAALALHLPLRSGALLRRLAKRGVMGRLPTPRLLYKIPLRWVPGRGPAPGIRTEPGMSRLIVPLLGVERGEGWYPQYDFDYIDWQVGRSPLIRCWSSVTPSEGEPRAAAVYWRPAASSDFWRLAVWCQRGQLDHLKAVVRQAVTEIYHQGGMAVSTLVSHLDADILRTLRSAGFLALGPRRALYVCAGKGGGLAGELRGLSYLDSDLGYRF